MASIKKAELDKLKQDEQYYREEYEAYFNAYTTLFLDYADLMLDREEWKGRTWQAEQEIHDLKVQAERDATKIEELEYAVKVYRDECVELIDEYVDECSARDELKHQYSDLLAQQVVHQVNEPATFTPLVNPTIPKEWNPGTNYSTLAPDLKSPEFIQSQTKRVNPLKKHFARIAISLLLLAMLGLGFVTYRQNQVIQYQRHILVEAAQYILQDCPPVPSQNDSVEHAQQ
jgi:hypothetical protein